MSKVKFQRATKSSRELRRMAQREQTREQRQKAIDAFWKTDRCTGRANSMSRWIETGDDERGRFYLETLEDPDGCKWLMNEVCCNGDNYDMVGDFPFEEDCTPERCPYFGKETQGDIDRLTEGVKTYDRT